MPVTGSANRLLREWVWKPRNELVFLAFWLPGQWVMWMAFWLDAWSVFKMSFKHNTEFIFCINPKAVGKPHSQVCLFSMSHWLIADVFTDYPTPIYHFPPAKRRSLNSRAQIFSNVIIINGVLILSSKLLFYKALYYYCVFLLLFNFFLNVSSIVDHYTRWCCGIKSRTL